jgi:outer membrane protein assembly factor BamE (lipoprotein component of BamABCDE complex)
MDMTKAEIEETLGKPNSKKSAIRYQDDASLLGKLLINAMFDGWYEKWYYGKDPSILSSIVPFYPFGPPNKTYIVYFNKDGRVAGYLEPSDDDNYKTRTRMSTGTQEQSAR